MRNKDIDKMTPEELLKFRRNRPYRERQEEIIRFINAYIVALKYETKEVRTFQKIRDVLIKEQNNLNGPTLAFVQACRLADREDLLL